MQRLRLTITRLLWLAVILYTGFSLSKAVWRNVKVNQRIAGLKQDRVKLEQDNNRLKDLIVYYQTDQFKEIELRRRLGYKRPDEQVVVLPQDFYQRHETSQNGRKPTKRDQIPYYLKWLETVTGLVI